MKLQTKLDPYMATALIIARTEFGNHPNLNTWTNLYAKTRCPHKPQCPNKKSMPSQYSTKMFDIHTERAGSPRSLAGPSNSSAASSGSSADTLLASLGLVHGSVASQSCWLTCWFTSRTFWFSRNFLAGVGHLLYGIPGSAAGLSAPWFTSMLIWHTYMYFLLNLRGCEVLKKLCCFVGGGELI